MYAEANGSGEFFLNPPAIYFIYGSEYEYQPE